MSSDHWPLTVAPATGLWAESCTWISTETLTLLPISLLEAVKSATCTPLGAGVTVEMGTGAGVAVGSAEGSGIGPSRDPESAGGIGVCSIALAGVGAGAGSLAATGDDSFFEGVPPATLAAAPSVVVALVRSTPESAPDLPMLGSNHKKPPAAANRRMMTTAIRAARRFLDRPTGRSGTSATAASSRMAFSAGAKAYCSAGVDSPWETSAGPDDSSVVDASGAAFITSAASSARVRGSSSTRFEFALGQSEG
jgi:hypothetical protein